MRIVEDALFEEIPNVGAQVRNGESGMKYCVQQAFFMLHQEVVKAKKK